MRKKKKRKFRCFEKDEKMSKKVCFECGSGGEIHQHHVVPKSLGGTATIPLCVKCHKLVHSTGNLSLSALIKEAYRRQNQREYEAEMLAQDLRRKGLGFRKISSELASKGYLNRHGEPFGTFEIDQMVEEYRGVW